MEYKVLCPFVKDEWAIAWYPMRTTICARSCGAQVSDRLRIEATIRTNKSEVVEIGMQLLEHIDGDWLQLVRYDNAHRMCHRHTFHPDGTESHHQFVAMLPATFLDQAQRELASAPRIT